MIKYVYHWNAVEVSNGVVVGDYDGVTSLNSPILLIQDYDYLKYLITEQWEIKGDIVVKSLSLLHEITI